MYDLGCLIGNSIRNQKSTNHTSAMKKVVLGFSGGLDTSYCVKYLTEDNGYLLVEKDIMQLPRGEYRSWPLFA